MRNSCRLTLAMILMILFSGNAVWGKSLVKKTLPQVPITYPGDTDETIARRAKWIEDARKEKELLYWGTQPAGQAPKFLAPFNKIYPFIKVNYWRGQPTEIAAQLEAENRSGRFSVDVVLGGSPANYIRWRKKGHFSKV